MKVKSGEALCFSGKTKSCCKLVVVASHSRAHMGLLQAQQRHLASWAALRRTIAEDRTKLKTNNQKTKKPKMICGPTAQALKPPNL